MWSPHVQLQWRVMRDDLVTLGFPVKIINRYQQEPLDGEDPVLHINPLELLGAIINVWLIIVWRKHAAPLSSGFVVDLWSDNTTSLAWLSLCATTRDPHLQPLTRLASALIVHAGINLTKIQLHHIPGVLNIEADALSRLHKQSGQIPSLIFTECTHSTIAIFPRPSFSFPLIIRPSCPTSGCSREANFVHGSSRCQLSGVMVSILGSSSSDTSAVVSSCVRRGLAVALP
jgi:hypothetical protein